LESFSFSSKLCICNLLILDFLKQLPKTVLYNWSYSESVNYLRFSLSIFY
jgi:hypothetical protein